MNANIKNRSMIVLLALCCIATACSQPQTPNEAFAKEALQNVRDAMKDPTSVKFKDVTAVHGAKCAFGQILAKNSYGAYAGYSPFVYSRGETVLGDMPDLKILDETEMSRYKSFLELRNACLKYTLEGNVEERSLSIPEA